MRIASPTLAERPLCRAFNFFAAALFLCTFACPAAAQSTVLEYPTPVRENQVSGTIAPRDLGDPRLTSYFYAFNGTPGDLVVTVEYSNLEGDVDVFTAGSLRPLAKVNMYGGSNRRGSKTIFLKRREPLILRVEARTPNDADGTFSIRFEGSFEPFLGEAPAPPEPATAAPVVAANSRGKKTRRVTSVGARIDEPEPEPAPEVPRPSEVESAATVPAEAPAETPAKTAESVAATRPTRPASPRTRRPRTPRNTRTRPPTTARRTTPESPAPAPAPAPAAEPAAGPRLIIETRDGTRVERYMTTVRRVTVERGQVVVVTTDGKVERQPMTNVLRMAIEP